MYETDNLLRFTSAQQHHYQTALAEITRGRKRGHWMWYIFPQIAGLALSETSRYYAIKNKEEAADYLQHPVLGKRLIAISNVLLQLEGSNATFIFGSPDDLKLRSCMTLFAVLDNPDIVFDAVLKKFFNGDYDDKTLELIGNAK